ncbi:MAG: hypothetical protein JJT94_13590 [Bernardetiaceae bacterium]|nr:hypothetical protein [Bernardetiaceae bacterium]
MQNLFKFAFVAIAFMLFSFGSVEASGLSGGGEGEKSSKVIKPTAYDAPGRLTRVEQDDRTGDVILGCLGDDGVCYSRDGAAGTVTSQPGEFGEKTYENVDAVIELNVSMVNGQPFRLYKVTFLVPNAN